MKKVCLDPVEFVRHHLRFIGNEIITHGYETILAELPVEIREKFPSRDFLKASRIFEQVYIILWAHFWNPIINGDNRVLVGMLNESERYSGRHSLKFI